jgi:hypothetical protein
MAGDAEDVVRAVIDAAKDGDMTAARLVLDRIAPPCRGRRVRLALPPIVGAADLVKALAAVADAMARGVLSAEEAQAAAAVLEHHRKAVETLDLEPRITALALVWSTGSRSWKASFRTVNSCRSFWGSCARSATRS